METFRIVRPCGPIRYARAARADELRGRMEVLAERRGERFRPDPGWGRLT